MANVKGLYQDSGVLAVSTIEERIAERGPAAGGGATGHQGSGGGNCKVGEGPAAGTRQRAAGEAPLRGLREWGRYYLEDRKRVGRPAVITSKQMGQRLASAVEYFGDGNHATATRAAVMG